jgi:hypothetical protein
LPNDTPVPDDAPSLEDIREQAPPLPPLPLDLPADPDA